MIDQACYMEILFISLNVCLMVDSGSLNFFSKSFVDG